MLRVETGHLNDALHGDTTAQLLREHNEPFSLTPVTGGTAIDQNENIHYSDVDRHETVKLCLTEKLPFWHETRA